MTVLTRVARGRKSIASGLVVALVVGVPLTIAALHPGFPVADVQLTSRDVWVTNGEQLLGGRLNRQIDELNGSVVASTPNFDVLQDGDAVFLLDPDAGRVESVNPATTEVTSAIEVPIGGEVAHGGTTLAIMSADGKLWAIPAVGDLQFNFVSTPPLLELGSGAHIAVSNTGVVVAVSPEKKTLYKIANLADAPVETSFPAVGEFQLAVAGENAVVFDQSTNEVVTENGSIYGLGDVEGLRLQQSSTESDFAYIAASDSLVTVDLGSGAVESIAANVEIPATDPSQVAAPVNLEGCAHAAWASAQRYVLACAGAETVTEDIVRANPSSVLEFRVNRSVIALNDLANGNVWLVDENMMLVENWEDVTPPEEEETEEEGDEKSAIQSFEDTLADRTETNRPPTAVDDDFGVRPGRTTILPILDNDTDPDGDVLVVSEWDEIAESTGVIDAIDGGRALQFTPAERFVGSIAFNYTVDDGREGSAQARVVARVVAGTTQSPPEPTRAAGVSVEANQTVSYNVLTDWRDPDGDDLYLIGASPKSGDLVRFTPDGLVTFTHQTSELGEKEVIYQVTDGSGAPAQGTLKVTVEQPGSLDPIGTPDFATAFVNESVTIEPLSNDLSPSGADLSLTAIDDPGGEAVASFSTDRGDIAFSSSKPGIFYVKYTVAAGAPNSVGIIRVDVRDKPADEDLPPVAVKDTAYLRGEDPVTVSVLSNDVSPAGRILAVQGINVPAALKAKGLVVELLESTLIRVTSPAALTEQVNFTYDISDGINTATAGVTVVPVPALTKHQPPVAKDDAVRVRVGDIITLDVLDNDFHPDDSIMFLDEELITPPEAGIAFVSKNRLRFQAPTTPNEYRVDYRVMDSFGETAAATAVFTVVGLDGENNQDPEPTPLVGRVLAGGSIRIDIPLNGIDPDGDSTQLLNFPSSPTLGSYGEVGTDYFIYEASPTGAGTDTFSYEVYDAFGATGVAEIKIAVIPEPDELQDPSAVPDSVSIRPGRIAQVDLLDNDSDPQGAPIKVSDELVDVPDGVKAEVVDGRYLVLTAPETEQSFSLRYELTNDRGGKVMSYVLVQVTPDAPLLPPTAEDLPILTKEIAGKQSITVNIFDGSAFNPSGRTEDLVVSIEGPNESAATLLEVNGQIEVTPGETRQAVAYRVTNVEDDLDAMAFILVPAAVDENFDNPPRIDPDLPVQYVGMNETREWNLPDILDVPSGREAWIFDEQTVTGVQSNGDPIFVDRDTIRFTPPADYRGPAAINFTVTDGDSANDPKGNQANLRLNIVVGDPEFRDTAPEFTTPNTQVEVGESTSIDLRASTGHPNPQILQEVSYSNLTGSSAAVDANLSGSTLTLTTPRNTPKGTTVTLGVTLRWDKFEVPGTINVTVVKSSRPLAVAVTDEYETQRGDGAVTTSPLANDSNPYQTTGEALTIIDAVVQNTGEPAAVSFTNDQITLTPSPSLKSGVVEVVYTVEDATEDADRHVNGTVRLVVSDVPDQVAKPTRQPDNNVGDDRSATYRFDAPASNGKEITSYDVQVSPSSGVVLPPGGCTAGAPCTITGLTNGTPYTLSARAVNVHGAGAWSTASDPVTPYGTPSQPAPALQSKTNWSPTASIRWNWPLVSGTGGNTTYAWTVSRGGSVVATGGGVDTTSATVNNLTAGSYSISVVATNTGGKSSVAGTAGPVVVENQDTPGTVSTPSTNVTNGSAPGAITWSWSAIGGGAQVTDNLQYVVRMNGSVVSTQTATSYSRSGLGAGSYSITVTAQNNAGSGGQSGVSAPGNISNPPTVTLRAGEANPYGTTGYRYNVTLSNFPAGNVTIRCFDRGGEFMSYVRPHTYSGDPGCYSDFGPHYVTANGIQSNVINSW